MTTPAPPLLPWTGDDEADRLNSADGAALLIGFLLDQQVPIEKAFSGPLVIRGRLGTLDPQRLAKLDPEVVRRAFVTPPAVHRFPAAMAERTQRLCAVLVDEYHGRAEQLWETAGTAEELARRIAALPGFGPVKATTLLAVLAKRLGVRPPGWEAAIPVHMTLADVVDPASLRTYRAGKRDRKQALAAAAAAPDSAAGGR